MTNATKTLTIIFVVLAVFTIGLKWSSGPTASKAFRSTLVAVDTSRVNKMIIHRPDTSSLTFVQIAGHWEVSAGREPSYPASGNDVENAIADLNNLTISAVTTRDPQKYTRYQVDSTGIEVILYHGDKLLADIFVGAPQLEGRGSYNNYVRLADEKTVYAVDRYLMPAFSKGLSDWRNKTVWDIDQSTITRVHFKYPADTASFSIHKTQEQKWVSSGDSLSSLSVNSLLGQLSTLKAEGFVDSLTVDGFGPEQYAIQLQLNSGKNYKLRLKNSPADSTIYIAASPVFDYVFTLNKDSFGDYVMKERSELLDD